jgi:DNA polymerase-3 subunit gamma/tau
VPIAQSSPLERAESAIEPAPPASAPAATPSTPAPAAPAAEKSADGIRARWPDILEAVKRERRVAWMILSNASVHSLDDNILTLRFARDGDLKGFTTSGSDADLKRILSNSFGMTVMVTGVTGVAEAARPAPVPSAAEPPTRRDSTPRYDGPPPPEEALDDEPDDDDPGPPGPPELTGMKLIQRELGAQIISETDS